MIIKKSDIKLVPASELTRNPTSKFDFEKVDAEMLTNIMMDRMTEMGGVALSAPQVGFDMSMFVMGINDAKIEVFNPKIISSSMETDVMNEGSLTYPGVLVIIKRPVSIVVEYYNKKGELQQNEFHGLTARIFQHAFDHLKGFTIKEKVSALKWKMAVKRLDNYKQKLVKKYTQKTLLDIKKSIDEQKGLS